ncbi:MAG: cadherin domain-containing protein [Pseudomonadales bacterium]|nr:cadherin domain-containing protein [Pseudomonadales bacterium]
MKTIKYFSFIVFTMLLGMASQQVQAAAAGAISDTDLALNQVPENAGAGAPVGITANASNAITYTLLDNAGGRFAIGIASGLVTATGSGLDADTVTSHNITVQATPLLGASSTETFTITVTPVNDNSPVFSSGTTASIAENTLITDLIYKATATDGDVPADTITYSIAGGADAADFSINGSGGITFNVSPDAEAPHDANTDNIYELTVRASDGTNNTDQAVTVTVTNVNDNAISVITDVNATADTVPENSPNGTATGLTARATDADVGVTVSYALPADGGGRFKIDPVTGVVTTSTVNIDREAASSYSILVRATPSDGGASVNQGFTISVGSVNDNSPAFTSTNAFSVAENTAAGATIYTATVSDADLPGDSFTYSIVGGTDAADFSVTAGGALSFVATPDAEAPADGDTNNVYSLILRVNDGASNRDLSLTVTVTNVNENTITAITDSDAGANTVAENSPADTAVGLTAAASDADFGATITYDLTDDAGGRFKIDASTGVVTTTGTATDYETATSHSITVRASSSDGSPAVTASYTINVTNLNDNATTAVTDVNAAADSVVENSAAGVVVGITASATDADTGATIAYDLTDNAGGRFQIDATTGVVTTTGTAIDREAATSYNITARATSSDGSAPTTQTFSITVTDQNDNAPVVTAAQSFSLVENSVNSTVVGTVLATDADTTGTLGSWQITSGNTSSAFAIDSSSGVITVNNVAALDYEVTTSFSLTVQVSDGVQNSAGQTVTVNLTDVVDSFPAAIGGARSYRVNVGEVYSSSSHRTDLWGSFQINPPYNTANCQSNCDYTAVSTGGDNVVTIDTHASFGLGDGWFRPMDVDGSSPYSTAGKQTFDVFATRKSDGAQSNALVFTVIVNGAPVITSDGGLATAAVSVAENATAVTDVDATDVNLPDDNLTYSISGGADAARFSIDSSTGVLTFQSAPDYETPTDADTNNVYVVEVRVQDQGSTLAGGLSDTQIISVTVTDENDIAPVIDNPGAISVDENIATTVVTMTASNDVDTSPVSWSITGGADAAQFSIVAGTGAITFVTPPDYEAPTDANADNSYELTVRVSDGVATDDLAITVNVQNLSDTNPTSADKTVITNEDTTYNFVLSDFAFADADGDTFGQVTLVTLPAAGHLELSGATISATGTVITAAQITSLSFVPDANDDGIGYASFTFNVIDSSAANSVDYTMTTNVIAVADTPSLSATATITPNEDEPGNLGLSASLTDSTNETLTVTISGLPVGASLTDGTSTSTSATTDVSLWNYATIAVTSPIHDDTDFVLTVQASAREAANADTASTSATVNVNVTAVADTPNLTVTSTVSGNEDTTMALTVAATLVDTDGSETLTYQISGVPTGATLNNGTAAGGGVYNLAAADVSGLSVTPLADSADDFTLTIKAITTEANGGSTAESTATIDVTVVGVADTPTISATASATALEDTASSTIVITSALTDVTAETLTVEVLGLPVGASISDGANTAVSAGAAIDITTWSWTTLTVTGAQHSDDDFTLTFRATATEDENGDTATTTATTAVTVTAVADNPNVTIGTTASGSEDTAIALPVSGSRVDTDGSETLTYQITGVPSGATLNNGADAGGGVWNLSEADASGLTLTPPLNDDSDFTIAVTATVNDNDGSTVVVPTVNIAVTVVAVADSPSVTVTNPVSGDEDTTVAITASSTLADTDGSESLSYEISGVLAAATLSAGTNNGGGVWTLTPAEMVGLTLTMAAHDASDFQIDVRALATEARDGSTAYSAPGAGRINITFNDIADAPTVSVTSNATGNEDTAIPLNISGTLVDNDGSETLTMVITGAPATTTFSAGSDLGGGVWGVSAADLAGLTISAAANNNDDFVLTVTATAEESANGSTATTSETITVTIQAVNDAPTVNDQAFSIDENSLNGTVVGTITATDIEPVGSESAQSLSYQLEGTAFSIDSNGIIRVNDVDQLDYETITEFNLLVTVTDNGLPAESDTATVTISLNPLNDNPPTGVADTTSVDEQATVAFNVLDNDVDPDIPNDVLTVTEVNDDAALVGVPVDLDVAGTIVGTLTINTDGSATFAATSDNTVEIFEVTASYTVTDGTLSTQEVPVTITINPINDNEPALSAAGIQLQTDGVSYDEDAYTSLASPRYIVLNSLFSDLDIDGDGLLDSNTSDDNDSLVFTVESNSNAFLVETNISGGDLALYSPSDEHGTAEIVIGATDTADPSGNITMATMTLTITVNSINDPPIYSIGTYSDITMDEDSGDITINLASAFSDADLSDSTAGDDLLTYSIQFDDIPNEFVRTAMIDTSGLTVISSIDDTPAIGATRVVVETTSGSITLPVNADAHGVVNLTVTARDEGRPPAAPAAAIPLTAAASFTVTVNAIGDDQPAAADDHYNDFPELVIEEDSDPIVFDVTLNDYPGDAPLTVISAGQEIVDSYGSVHRWRTTSRMADTNDTGDYVIEINGEVSCGHTDCQSNETGDTTIDGSSLTQFTVMYKPKLNFNGEDSFTYCIQDSAPASEAPFLPPSDPRCATVTVNVTPVNDKPVPQDAILFTMEQADDLVVPVETGLRTKVQDVDNSHLDGLGCNPADSGCTSTADTLYFQLTSAVTAHGQLLPPFLNDGSFTYRPDATFAGEDSFTFDVCDVPLPGDADHCVYGVTASIQIQPLQGAPEGSTSNTVEFDYQLAQTPLELPIGPEPNVLLVNDDSGSMDWDILTDQTNGLYYFSSGNYLNYVMKATAGSSTSVAPSEESAPNAGLWRLRSSDYNKIYYNPQSQYKPWEGLDTNDVAFPDSPPTAAKHHPLQSTVTNLTVPQNYTGRAVVTQESCRIRCVRKRRGRCIAYQERCSTSSGFQNVSVSNYYIPRYYTWNDLNGNEVLDAVPSPYSDPANSEGTLVEIKPASAGGSDTYPKYADRTDCKTISGLCSYDEELQNFANWFTYYRNREFTAKAALGKVVAAAENIRIGYAKLNSTSNLKRIVSMNTSERTGPKAELLDAIYTTNSSGGTPLRRSLRDAGRYFECRSGDIFNSGSNSSPGSSRCPVLPAPEGNCQQNFTLLITDGTWNGSNPYIYNEDSNNNSNFDGNAYAGSTSDTLADVAMYYYERDLHPTLNNEVPTSGRDRAGAASNAFENASDEFMHQHMTTFTVGFGVTGLIDDDPVDYTQSFTWGNPYSSSDRKIDDLRHAAYNGRGAYLDASSAKELADALIDAFEEFAQGSGAASAVSFNSQEIQEDTLIFRAFYNTKINTGNLIAQSLTDEGLVEEPVWESAKVMDGVDADDREILTFDRVNNVGIPFRPGNLNDDQKAAFITDQGASDAQKNTEVTQRVNYLRGDTTNERPVGNFRERPAVEGRLGDIVHSTPVFVGAPSRLGRDAVPYPQTDLYTSFKASNESRDELIYVEANDGMVHGFSAEDGSEVFAFIPDNLMTGTFSRNITELLNYEYTHKFFMDVTPAINDVYMDADGDGNKEWTTILVGGHGAGAKAYFALNITDPSKLTEATAEDVVMWEFTDADDAYPTNSDGTPLTNDDGSQRQDLQDTPQPVKDLGYSFSVPTLAMSNLEDDDGEKIWVSIFGNGYNSTSGIAKLYVLFLDGGVDGIWCHPDMIHNEILNGTMPAACVGKQDYVKINTGFGVEGGYPNGLGTPRGIDIDGNGTVDYAYAGDTFGNFFRFDLTSTNYDDWSFTKIFEAAYTDSDGNVTRQPITTQPIVTTHPTQSDGYIVIFATGSYITIPDGSSSEIQSIYGLWDRLSPELLSIDDMVQQHYTNVNDANFGNVRVLSNNEVDYEAAGKKGWYNHLDSVEAGAVYGVADPEFPGERAIRNIQLRGGIGFVNSVIPRSATSCVDVAGGFALSFCPGTGGTNCLDDRGVFDLNNDGGFDDGDKTNGQVVAGLRFEDAVPTDSSFIEDKRITQLSDKSLDYTATNTTSGTNTGRLSWKQLKSID